MSRATTTIDDLLGDSLIQAVMRADRVDPQALRTLLAGAATRVARSGRRSTSALASGPPIDRRLTPRGANGPSRARPALLDDPCGSALCC